MALNIDQKKAIVSEVSEIAVNAHSAIAAEYNGLSVGQLTELRCKARESGVYMRVVKNSLAKRAVEGTDFACISDALVGPLILAFSQEDPGAAARVVSDFAKDNDRLVVKIVSIGGKLLAPDEITRLAKMPTKDQAISMLMSVMQAPVTKLVRTLAEPHGKLVRTLAAVRDQKQSA